MGSKRYPLIITTPMQYRLMRPMGSLESHMSWHYMKWFPIKERSWWDRHPCLKSLITPTASIRWVSRSFTCASFNHRWNLRHISDMRVCGPIVWDWYLSLLGPNQTPKETRKNAIINLEKVVMNFSLALDTRKPIIYLYTCLPNLSNISLGSALGYRLPRP